MQIPSMSYKVLALAPFRAVNNVTWSENSIPVDKTDLDQVIADLGLSLYVQIPGELCPAGGFDIKISRFKDFHPDQLVQNINYLKNLVNAGEFIKNAMAKGTPIPEINRRIQEWPNLPHLTLETETPKPEKSSTSAIDNILDMVALPDEQTSTSPQKLGILNQIDNILKKILNHIFSDKTFSELEAIWRGVKLFFQQVGKNGDIKLEIVPVSSETLSDTLDALTATLVQDLPSLIIVDLPFSNSSLSLEHLEKIANFSETLMVPAICWVTKDFLYLDSWKDFGKLPFLPNHLDESHYAKWHKLEQSSAGRWMAVTCNRILGRYSYGYDNKPRNIYFNEKKQLWISPVWAVAGLMAQSFVKTGWPTRFTDHQKISIEDLPLNSENTGKPVTTETFFTNNRLDQFKRIGIMPLTCIQNKDIAFTPVETTVAGNSLRYQALLSTLTKFIFWCLDNFSKDLEPSAIEDTFIKAFSMFWEKTGHLVYEEIRISAGEPGPDNRIPLHIEINPPLGILSSGQKIELEFAW